MAKRGDIARIEDPSYLAFPNVTRQSFVEVRRRLPKVNNTALATIATGTVCVAAIGNAVAFSSVVILVMCGIGILASLVHTCTKKTDHAVYTDTKPKKTTVTTTTSTTIEHA